VRSADRRGKALGLERRSQLECGGYQGPKAATAAAKTGRWTIVIVARSTTAVGFKVLPKRWIVERTFAWINRLCRLVRDFERYARTVAAFIRLAMIRIMPTRLVANPSS
jgi:transposase